MKRVALLLIVVLGGAALLWLWFSPVATTETIKENVEPEASPIAVAAQTQPHAIPADVQQKLDYANFQESTRHFFDHEKSLSDKQRQQRAQQIDEQTGQFQQQGFLSASEALMLKLAILKLTLDDNAFEQQGKALIDRYKHDYNVAYEQWLNTPDPQFEAYKVQEAEIVKRVMAMTSFPDGLSRDEYLRRELERARIAAYQEP